VVHVFEYYIKGHHLFERHVWESDLISLKRFLDMSTGFCPNTTQTRQCKS